MNNDSYSKFISSTDELVDDLSDIAGGSLTISDAEFSSIDLRIGKIRSLLRAIEMKKKIVDILETKNDTSDLPTNSKYYDQDASQRKFCYECKSKIRSDKFRHGIHRSMCILCGNINMFKRDYKSNQTGKVAIVTGGRIKIGFETALSLLKNGATVIVTTRFVDDCFERFTKDDNFETFKNRLEIYQLNMMIESNINQFVKYIKERYDRIDYLINNAAQTIRRPKEFYKHVIDKYDTFSLDNAPQIVNRNSQEIDYLLQADANINLYLENVDITVPRIMDVTEGNIKTEIIPEVTKYFPPGQLDQFGQQIDLRQINSWMLELDLVSRKEFIEILIVNVVGPFILCQEFKDLMGFSNSDKLENEYSWIINVTSMEGIFNWKFKPTRHPQTNIAKAALNMMTRTCGGHYIESGIVMVGVETGWNNSQQPDSYERITPLDCKDGSARILDPIYRRLKQHSVIYKDYKIFDY